VKRLIATSLLLLTLVFVNSNESRADEPTVAEPARGPVLGQPAIDFSTAIPSTDDVLNVPVPQANNLLAYPVNVFGYLTNVHPGARVIRHNRLLRFGF
jgi:hypothetical protein